MDSKKLKNKIYGVWSLVFSNEHITINAKKYEIKAIVLIAVHFWGTFPGMT